MQDEHQQLKDKQFDDTLDISVECSRAKDRFSLDTVTSDLLSEHPKSQSSPSKSDSSAGTTRNLDSIDVNDSTQSNIEELCKTSCGFKTLCQNGEITTVVRALSGHDHFSKPLWITQFCPDNAYSLPRITRHKVS